MEKYDVTKPVILKKGVYKLNDEANFNYQLNRVINWGGGRLEDVQKVSGKIHNTSTTQFSSRERTQGLKDMMFPMRM